MAANEKLSIKFEAVGAKGLQNAINAVALASDRLMLSTRKYNKALANLNHNQKDAVARMFDIQTATRNTGNAFSVLRSKMLLVSFAFLVVGNSIGRLLKASADLEELMNKANVVFGNQIDIVTQWADTLGNTIGRATSEILSMATAFQDTFVPLGFTREAATQLSVELSKLAIDVASFNNQMDEQTARDFQSAIVGNHETVRKYGIIITESRLKQEALNLGLIKGSQMMTAQQKVLARLSLIRKGSRDAENDAINTSTSFTNQVKAMNAELLESAQMFGNVAKNIVTFGFQLGNAHISLLGLARQLARKEVMTSFMASITMVGGALLFTNRASIDLSKTMGRLRKIFTRTHIGIFAFVTIVTGALTLIQRFGFGADSSREKLESLEEAIKEASDSAGLLAEGEEGYSKAVSESIVKLQRKINILKATNEIEKYKAEITHEITEEEISLLKELRDVNEEYKERQAVLKGIERLSKKGTEEELKAERDLQLGFMARKKELEDLIKEQENARISEIEGGKKAAQNFIEGNNLLSSQKKLLKDVSKGNKVAFDESQLNIYRENLEDTEKAIENQSKNIRKLEIKLGKESPFTRMSEAFKKEVDLISSDLEEYEQVMFSIVDASLNAKAGIENAFLGMAEQIMSSFTSITLANAKENIQRHKDNANANIAALKETRRYQKASAKQKEEMEKEQRDIANNQIRADFKMQQQANKASVTMDFAAAVMKIFKEQPFRAPLYYGVLSAIYLAQLELINSAQPPTMQYGGLVGGSSHAQGGTVIEAERGEYVVNKQAVDAIGLETLNRINTGQGGGGGSINISFEGNVMSNDFIEDEAIPKIKEAIRRGADIGLS